VLGVPGKGAKGEAVVTADLGSRRGVVRTRTPLIDTDIHPILKPEHVAEFLGEPWRRRYMSGNQGPGRLGYWNPHDIHRADAVADDGTRIEADPKHLGKYFFDAYGIEYGILNLEHLDVALSPEPDYAAAVLAARNDAIVHYWLSVDARFRASLTVTTVDPDLAAREIHRLGDHPGIVQVLLPSGARMPYGQKFYHPIYAAAVEYDLPVAIHPGSEGLGVCYAPTAAGFPSSYFEWHTGIVTNYIAHFISLITEGVFVKFPSLRFVLMEGGVCWVPPLLWRFDKNWKALRQTTPWLVDPPSEVARRHVRLTTQPLEEPERREDFARMLEMFDAGSMLLFSSDFPHWDGDMPDFSAARIPRELRERIMSENARALYRLPATKHV
jgi:uncharacterized protein